MNKQIGLLLRHCLRGLSCSGLLLLCTALFCVCPAAAAGETIVAPTATISDFEARLLLAQFLAAGDSSLAEAENEYRRLVAEAPHNVAVMQGFAGLLVRLNRPREARHYLEAAWRETPGDEKLSLALARVESELGQVRQAHDRVNKICGPEGGAAEFALSCAEVLVSWGDFYEAEALCRRHLAAHPEDTKGRLLLADILIGSQRFVEAEAILGLVILDFPELPEPYTSLIRAQTLNKDFTAALAVIDNVPSAIATTPALLLAAGQMNLEARHYQAALAWFRQAADHTPSRSQALLGMARAYRGAGQETEGQRLLAAWPGHLPNAIEAQYLAAGSKQVAKPDFPASPLVADKATPESLVAWARLMAADGLTANAISCYEAALVQDRNFFSARLERAELLAVVKRYDEAIAELAKLVADFPTNPKVLLTQARVLAWARHYEKAIAAYEALAVLNPANPTIWIEQARTAVWGKQMMEAERIYARLWAEPVDQQLLTAIKGLVPADWLAEIGRRNASGPCGDGYEWFSRQVQTSEGDGGVDHAALERIKLTLLPPYRIQKAAFLENQAKGQVWDNRLTSALDSYAKLLDVQPGNQEARFDNAQLQCALGLCDEAEKSYQELLAISPLHNLAALALERQQRHASPSSTARYLYWGEQGRGELASMDRQQADLLFTLPLFCRARLQVTARHWLESPGGTDRDFDANGLGLRFYGTASQYLRGAIEVNKKHYQQSELDDLDSGSGELWVNFRDSLKVGIGVERRDELANRFALAQGVQADHWWLGLEAPLAQRLEVTARTERLDYSDDNQGNMSSVSLGYAVSDHPRKFKVSVVGESRDSHDTNITINQGNEPLDIVHPYWTPQGYTAAQLVLAWSHDLSEHQFCGAEQHTYDIKLGLGTDSEDNPAVRVEAEYLYEFAKHWRLQLRGLMHSSREWDALGFQSEIGYRF